MFGLLVLPVSAWGRFRQTCVVLYGWSLNTSACVASDIAAFALSGPSTTADRSYCRFRRSEGTGHWSSKFHAAFLKLWSSARQRFAKVNGMATCAWAGWRARGQNCCGRSSPTRGGHRVFFHNFPFWSFSKQFTVIQAAWQCSYVLEFQLLIQYVSCTFLLNDWSWVYKSCFVCTKKRLARNSLQTSTC